MNLFSLIDLQYILKFESMTIYYDGLALTIWVKGLRTWCLFPLISYKILASLF